jgi:hypothetical protein
MVARGYAGAAALAMALASVGAFAPGSAFVRSPMNPASYGIDRIINKDGSVVTSDKVRRPFHFVSPTGHHSGLERSFFCGLSILNVYSQ